ncbi:hypothetical protein MTO96_042692, partial [Rhipicephalus appendiculatus]
VPLAPGSILCTISRGFKKITYTFPPDGLCAIITFDSLYDDNQTLAPPYKQDFEFFIETSKKYKLSEFGIGIKQDTCSDLKAMQKIVSDPSTKKHLDDLWNRHRIYHYGQVSGTMGYRSEVPVDIFVVVVHYAGPDINLVNCHMVPPTILTADLVNEVGNITYYQVRMGLGITNLAANYQHWPVGTQCAMSLDMGGRWYEPCGADAEDYKLGKKCGYSCMKQKVQKETQITEIARACKRQDFRKTFYTDYTFDALVTYNVQRELVFTYDGPINLRKKLCKAKVNATNVLYTFAAVNIDKEDVNGSCGFGPFPRLKMLKNLAEFFAFKYSSPAKLTDCMKVSYKPKNPG